MQTDERFHEIPMEKVQRMNRWTEKENQGLNQETPRPLHVSQCYSQNVLQKLSDSDYKRLINSEMLGDLCP
jgi:hypothetical protein